MRIHTKVEVEWSDLHQTYILLSETGFDYESDVEGCKGASTAQTNLANSQAQFYNNLTNDYGTAFKENQGIVSNLTNALQPIIAAGPNQNGFNQEETDNLNAQAIQGSGQQYANAKKALQETQASQGGGNMFLPSGVQSQENAQLAAAGANQTSSQLMGVKQAGYQQGYNTYESALGQLEGTANLVNPTAYAGSANASGNDAFSSATEVQKLNNAASPLNVLGGVLGGVAGAVVNPVGAALGGNLAGAMRGSGGGGSASGFGGGQYDSSGNYLGE